jgi:hypothetical protein
MSGDKFEQSLGSGVHHQLNALVGEWTGSTKTWFEPSTLADESPVSGSISSLLDSRFVQLSYHGSFQGKPVSGICIWGYHLGSGKIQSSWIDSSHTGMEIMFGEGTANSRGFEYTASYFAGEDQPRWNWRTIVELNETNELLITAYNISPEGEETKAQETVYRRK